jgi:hypothetical protein
MGDAMEQDRQQPYRLFVLNDQGHICKPAIERQFATDEEAISYAQSKLDGHGIEVWHQRRLVARLDPILK